MRRANRGRSALTRSLFAVAVASLMLTSGCDCGGPVPDGGIAADGGANDAGGDEQAHAPRRPGPLEITAGAGTLTVEWSAVAGASGYRVFASTSEGAGPANGIRFDVSAPGLVHEGLAPSTTVHYTALAYNEHGESPLSDEVSGTTPAAISLAAPSSLQATVVDDGISLAWDAVEGATSYVVYWARTAGVGVSSAFVRGASSPFLHTALSPGETGYYAVAAVATGAESALSVEVSATLPMPGVPLAPNNLQAIGGDGVVTLTWDPVSGANGYHLYVSPSADVDVETAPRVAWVSSPYVHAGLVNDTAHHYVVTAIGVGGESVPSAEVSATPTAGPPLAPPYLVALATTDGAIEVAWGDAPRAQTYTLTWAAGLDVSPSAGTVVAGLVEKTWRLEGPADDVVYSFVVAGVNQLGEGEPAPVARAHLPLGIPSGLVATAGVEVVSLDWTASGDATSSVLLYTVDEPFLPEQATRIEGVAPPFSHENLLPGSVYRYAVASVRGAIESPPVGIATAKTAPAAPGGLTATAHNNRIALAWESVPSASSYTVYWSTSPGVTPATGTAVGGVLSPAWDHRDLVDGTSYYYIVASVESTLEGAPSDEVSATASVDVPAAPASLTATAGAGRVALAWSAADGASAYDIYGSDSSGVRRAHPTSSPRMSPVPHSWSSGCRMM